MEYVRIFIVLCLIAIFSAADALSATGQGGACGFLPTGDFICGKGAAAPKVPSGASAAKALRPGASPGATGGAAASGGSASGALSGTASATRAGASSTASSLTGTRSSVPAPDAAKMKALLEQAKQALAAEISAIAAGGGPAGGTGTCQPNGAPGAVDLSSSPASRKKGIDLIYSFDSLWKDLISKGQGNTNSYYGDIGHTDTRNKCGPSGCTRSLATFGGRATMKFTTHAGYNYSASASDGGQVSQTQAYFTRKSGKSYRELMHTADICIPSSSNFHIPQSLYQTQSNAGKIGRKWDECKIGGKGPIGVISGQVNPLPPPGGLEDGWQYVWKSRGRKAAVAITGPATFQFGNRECSGFYDQFKFTGMVGWWGPDIGDYMGGITGQPVINKIIPRDKWITLELYGKLDTNGRNGIVEVYLDGEQILRNSNVNWGGSQGWRFVGFGGLYMWGGAGAHMVPRDTTSIYYSHMRVFGKE